MGRRHRGAGGGGVGVVRAVVVGVQAGGEARGWGAEYPGGLTHAYR